MGSLGETVKINGVGTKAMDNEGFLKDGQTGWDLVVSGKRPLEI